MCNFYASRLVIETLPILYSNTSKHFVTINSHLITSLKMLVFTKTQ